MVCCMVQICRSNLVLARLLAEFYAIMHMGCLLVLVYADSHYICGYYAHTYSNTRALDFGLLAASFQDIT